MLMFEEEIEEEKGSIPEMMENEYTIAGFRIQFLNDENEMHFLHKVEVRNINFQDLMRHLRHGESVLITPKLQESSIGMKKYDQIPWYFTHI